MYIEKTSERSAKIFLPEEELDCLDISFETLKSGEKEAINTLRNILLDCFEALKINSSGAVFVAVEKTSGGCLIKASRYIPRRLHLARRYITFVAKLTPADFFAFCERSSPDLKDCRCTLYFYKENYYLAVKSAPCFSERIKYTLLEWGEQAPIQNLTFYTEYATKICKESDINRLFSLLYR